MKIYTKVVVDIASGKITESVSEEYEGPLAKANLGGNPLASTPTVAGAAIPGLGPVMMALQAAQGVNNLVGPQGALVTGDIGKGVSAAQGLMGAYNGFTGGNPVGAAAVPTLESKLNMTKAEFDAYPPEVRQELLRQVMGR